MAKAGARAARMDGRTYIAMAMADFCSLFAAAM
jgi:hypothetical protein